MRWQSVVALVMFVAIVVQGVSMINDGRLGDRITALETASNQPGFGWRKAELAYLGAEGIFAIVHGREQDPDTIWMYAGELLELGSGELVKIEIVHSAEGRE